MSKLMKVLALVLFATALAVPMWQPNTVEGQGGTEALTTDMDAKTPNDLFNGFGALGTPIDECVAEPEPPTARLLAAEAPRPRSDGAVAVRPRMVRG